MGRKAVEKRMKEEEDGMEDKKGKKGERKDGNRKIEKEGSIGRKRRV